MIKAKPYQQQPPNPAECPFCHERFNNARRAYRHALDMARIEDGEGYHDDPEMWLLSDFEALSETPRIAMIRHAIAAGCSV